ncbi:MAG: FecR family protein [Cyclobacteriaceae bacterium]
MKYNDYKLEDFLTDEFFICWVFQPSKESNQFWQNWIKTHPETKNKIQKAKEIILATRFEQPQYHPETKDEVLAKIMKGYTSNYHHFQKKQRKSIIWKVAASLVFVIIAGIGILQFEPTQDAVVEQPSNDIITKVTLAGQKLSVVLPDGSEAMLNSSSKLIYTKEFIADQRLVELSGEAFFKVKEDVNRPFIVKSGDFSTKVLGTSFNINEHSVSLLTGKVEVLTEDQATTGIILTPGQKAVHDKAQKSFYKTSYNYQQDVGWKDGILYFKDADFITIKNRLQKWYGIEIVDESNFNRHWNYTGTFEKASLEEVLQRIAYLEGFSFSINDKKVKIYGN